VSGPRVGTSRHGALFWVGVAIGWAAMVFGLRGLWDEQRPEQVVNWALYLVGLDLLHDALVAPALCAVGVGLARLLRPPLRVPVQVALIASGAVLLVAWAPLARTGDVVGNPTIQPLDYPTAVATALGLVWFVCGALGVFSWRRRARSRPGTPAP